jgi:regulator of nucleoside diphosphate kinase
LPAAADAGVTPEDSHIDESQWSVVAPVGTELLGYEAGDIVEWPVPSGLRPYRSEEVSSPERTLLRVSC